MIKRKKIFIFSIGLIFLVIFGVYFIFFIKSAKSVDEFCCNHECQPYDAPKCDGKKIFVCGKCDADYYYDWCEQKNCEDTGQICEEGKCETLCAITCVTGPGCKENLLNGKMTAGVCCGTGSCYECNAGYLWDGTSCVKQCIDNDKDGYGNPSSEKCEHSGLDCDDGKNFIYLGAAENCDGFDNNCDGEIDENCDKDDDGYCDKNKKIYNSPIATCLLTSAADGANGNDCDDVNKNIHPGKTEICGNGIDEDCSGADLACILICIDYDRDGYGVCPNCGLSHGCANEGNDCDDVNKNIHPGKIEICGNGIDEDCSGADLACNSLTVTMIPKNDENFNLGDLIWFSASVTGGTAPFTFNWKINGEDFHTKGPTSDTWDNASSNSLSAGIKMITLTVKDNAGNEEIKSAQIKINALGSPAIKCFNFTDCDDGNPCTTDICNNAGKIDASCSNSPIAICQNNDNCCVSGCNNSNDNDCPLDAGGNDDPSKVLVIYNDKCATDGNNNGIKDFYEMALYYQKKRGIPEINMLPVEPNVGSAGCSTYYYQSSSYPTFYNDIVKKIQDKLAVLGEENINYFLLIGAPIKMAVKVGGAESQRSLDNALMTVYNIESVDGYPSGWNGNPYYESSPTIGTDKGRFVHSYKFSGKNMYLVARILDTQMIDRALYGERYIYNEDGYYRGLGYVDTRYSKYADDYLRSNYPIFSGTASYNKGDRQFAYLKIFFDDTSWNYKWERYETEIGEATAKFTDDTSASTAPNALWYGGWYNFARYIDAWNWMPGAAACDLNSDSGITFLKKAFTAGLTVGAGCTDEPYLEGHPRPEIFIYHLLKGYNFAEAAALSNPAAKWRDIFYGDPIYNPNKTKTKVKDAIAPNLHQVFVKTDLADSDTACAIIANIDINGAAPEVAVFRLEYGLDSSYGNAIDYNAIYTTEKQFNLTGLLADNAYHYKVFAKDAVGNIAQSADKIFKTSANKTIMPASLTCAASAQIGNAPFTVNFTANPAEAPISYVWNFGDGAESNEKNPTHIFSNKGFYKAFLSVVFSNGLTRVKEFAIVVK